MTLSALNRLVRQVQASSARVQRVEAISSTDNGRGDGGILPSYLLTLTDESSSPLLLTLPPRTHVKLLRIEQGSLEVEVLLYRLVDAAYSRITTGGDSNNTNTSTPRLLAYDLTPKKLRGTPFLLSRCSFPLKDLVRNPSFDDKDHNCSRAPPSPRRRCGHRGSPRQRQSLVQALSQLRSCFFGPLNWVASRRRVCRSWRLAFCTMLEDTLRDGEDMLVALPYESIRSALARLSDALDDVQEARVVLLDLGRQEEDSSLNIDDSNDEGDEEDETVDDGEDYDGEDEDSGDDYDGEEEDEDEGKGKGDDNDCNDGDKDEHRVGEGDERDEEFLYENSRFIGYGTRTVWGDPLLGSSSSLSLSISSPAPFAIRKGSLGKRKRGSSETSSDHQDAEHAGGGGDRQRDDGGVDNDHGGENGKLSSEWKRKAL